MVFKDRQERKEYPIDITNENFIIMKAMIQTMSSYRHSGDEFYVEKEGEVNSEISLKVVHMKAIYKGFDYLVAYFEQSSFLELIDELMMSRRH